MKIVCSWCHKQIKEVEPLEDLTISHGICLVCAEKVREDLKKLKGESYGIPEVPRQSL